MRNIYAHMKSKECNKTPDEIRNMVRLWENDPEAHADTVPTLNDRYLSCPLEAGRSTPPPPDTRLPPRWNAPHSG